VLDYASVKNSKLPQLHFDRNIICMAFNTHVFLFLAKSQLFLVAKISSETCKFVDEMSGFINEKELVD
jgi:hypothetical protein